MKFEEALAMARNGAKIRPVGSPPGDYVRVVNGTLADGKDNDPQTQGEDIWGYAIISSEWEADQ